MSNQVLITILPANSTTTQNVSFNSDMIMVTEVTGDATIFSKVSYFGDPRNPASPSGVYKSTQTVAQIVASSNNTLVQATIWQQGASTLASSLQMAFPDAGFSVNPSTGNSNVNSIISYRGTTYSAQETVAVLSNRANITSNSAILSASFPVTSSTLANVTDMFVGVNANSKYYLKIVLRATCATANGINFAVTAPASSTLNGGAWLFNSTSTSALQLISFTIGSATSLATIRYAGAGTIELDAYITTSSTSGTFQLQMASATNLDTSTLNAGAMHLTYLGAA